MRDRGSLAQGVGLPGGGRLRVELGEPEDYKPLFAGATDTNDNSILRVALRLHQGGREAISFVSRDTNMRLKADALGIPAEDYEHAHVEVDEAYTGVIEREVDGELINELYQRSCCRTRARPAARTSS